MAAQMFGVTVQSVKPSGLRDTDRPIRPDNPASAGALMLWLREQVQAAEGIQNEETQP